MDDLHLLFSLYFLIFYNKHMWFLKFKKKSENIFLKKKNIGRQKPQSLKNT